MSPCIKWLSLRPTPRRTWLIGQTEQDANQSHDASTTVNCGLCTHRAHACGIRCPAAATDFLFEIDMLNGALTSRKSFERPYAGMPLVPSLPPFKSSQSKVPNSSASEHLQHASKHAVVDGLARHVYVTCQQHKQAGKQASKHTLISPRSARIAQPALHGLQGYRTC